MTENSGNSRQYRRRGGKSGEVAIPFHQRFTNKIIEELENGTAPWQKPWEPGRQLMMPHNPVSKTVYRGINHVNLSVLGNDDPRYLTYNQAAKMGLQVKKGSKAQLIVFWSNEKEVTKRDDNGKAIPGPDGKAQKEKVKLEQAQLGFANVFNAKDIEGMPPLQLTAKAHEWEPQEVAESILMAAAEHIRHTQSDRAFVRGDEIHLPPRENFPTPERYYGTAFGQLAMRAQAKDRLDILADEPAPNGSPAHVRKLMRAEIASWMICEQVGIPHEPNNSVSFVKECCNALRKDPWEILNACRDAERIKNHVLDMAKEITMDKSQGVVIDVEAVSREPQPAKETTPLSVPFDEYDDAKRLGAQRNDAGRLEVPEGQDLTKFEKWLPENQHEIPAPANRLSPDDEVAYALEKMNLELSEPPVMDGQPQIVYGRNGVPSGVYQIYPGEKPQGWAQNFSTGERREIVTTGHILSAAEIHRQKQVAAEVSREFTAERAVARSAERTHDMPPPQQSHGRERGLSR